MPRLTRTQHESFTRRVVAGIAEPSKHITPAKAYQQVYGVSDRSASVGASALLARPDIRARIQETLEVAFPADHLRTHLAALLSASTPIVSKGEIIGDKPEHAVRLETVRTILRVLGAYRLESTSTTDNRSVNFFINAKELEGLSSTVQELERLSRKMVKSTGEHEPEGMERSA